MRAADLAQMIKIRPARTMIKGKASIAYFYKVVFWRFIIHLLSMIQYFCDMNDSLFFLLTI